MQPDSVSKASALRTRDEVLPSAKCCFNNRRCCLFIFPLADNEHWDG